MINNIIYIDVCDLPAPGPLEKVLELLRRSLKNEIICMIHRQSPYILFNILKERGYDFFLTQNGNLINIYIWHTENKGAPNIIKKEIERVQ